MTEQDRLVIAESLAEAHVNHNWIFAPDNVVPATAAIYAVYDGTEVVAGGTTIERVPDAVARCRTPIVFFIERGGQ